MKITRRQLLYICTASALGVVGCGGGGSGDGKVVITSIVDATINAGYSLIVSHEHGSNYIIGLRDNLEKLVLGSELDEGNRGIVYEVNGGREETVDAFTQQTLQKGDEISWHATFDSGNGPMKTGKFLSFRIP